MSEQWPLSSKQLAALVVRSNARGLRRLAGHLCLIAGAGWLVSTGAGTLWYWPAAFVLGVGLVTLFAPLHETIHYTAFASRWLNEAVAGVCGLVLVLPPRYFRAFHLQHHRHTQDAARDPELATPAIDSRLAYAVRVSGLPYWTERLVTTLRLACGVAADGFIRSDERGSIVREARHYSAAYAALLAVTAGTSSTLLLEYWLIPVLLAQPLLRLHLLAEHSGCPFVRDDFSNTRTTLTHAGWRWLFWNMPYHAEHHAYAAIPFHALPAAHAALRERVAVLAPGYLSFHRRWLRDLAWVRPGAQH